MKSLIRIPYPVILLVAALILSSCGSSVYFYQVFTVESDKVEKNNMVFSDGKLTLSYNLWSEKGMVMFSVKNETDEYITIHLNQSFFVKNETAYDYFHNTTTSTSSSQTINYGYSLGSWSKYSSFIGSGGLWNIGSYQRYYFANSSVSHGVTNTQAKTTIEKPLLTIPPKSQRILGEYEVNGSYLNVCNLIRYVKYEKALNTNDSESPQNLRDMIKGKSTVSTEIQESTPVSFVTFSKDDSPFRFRNIIAYTVEQSDKLNRIDHSFYVSEVQNVIDKNFIRYKEVEDCGKKNGKWEKYSPFASLNRFFISYQ